MRERTSLNPTNPVNPELVQKAEEFRKIYEKFVEDIYRYVFFRVYGDTPVAEDLTSKTMHRALEAYLEGRYTEISGVNSPKPWLLKIAHNAVANYRRDHFKRHVVISLDKLLGKEDTADAVERHIHPIFPQDTTNPEEIVMEQQKLQELLQIVKELPPHYQDIIYFRYIAGLSNKEIGVILGKTEGAIQSACFRAIKRLRKIYQIPQSE